MNNLNPLTELRDEQAILNFIFSNSQISFAPPPAASAAAGESPGASKFKEDEEKHREFTKIESAAVTAAEDGKLDEAKEIMDKLCSDAPDRASAFNNRAQLRRMMGDLEGAKRDLDDAIDKAKRWLADNEASEHPLSEFHRGVLRQAYTQRAAYYNSKGASSEEARDLAAASALGSAIARMIATKSNPYATMYQAAVDLMMEQNLPKAAASSASSSSSSCAVEPSTSSSSAAER